MPVLSQSTFFHAQMFYTARQDVPKVFTESRLHQLQNRSSNARISNMSYRGLLLVLGCLLATILGVFATRIYWRPSLVMEQHVIDFGKVTVGDHLEKTIRVSNLGRAPLLIKSIKVSCSCLSGRIDKKELAAGEHTNLTIILSENSPHQVASNHVILTTNDPRQLIRKVEVRSICHAGSVRFKQHAFDLGRIPRGDLPVTHNATVLLPARVQNVIAEINDRDSGSVSVKLQSKNMNHTGAVSAVIEIGETCPSGNVVFEIKVGQKSDAVKDTFTLSASIVGNVYASPSYVTFRKGLESTRERVIRLVRRSDDSSVVPDNVSVGDTLAKWIQVDQLDETLVVRFSPNPEFEKDALLTLGRRVRGSISIRTREDKETINIPIDIWP